MSTAADRPSRIIPGLAYGLDLLGVAVFAISGALAGMQRGLDLFGVGVLAASAGVGGGTLRDLLLNRQPIFWMKDPKYLYAIILATSAAVLAQRHLPITTEGWLVADALGLALCALSGAQIAQTARYPWIVIILLGTVSGTAGGVMRDVLSGVVPLLLRRDIYATAAIAGICGYLILQRLGLKRSYAFVTGIFLVMAIRLIAIAYGWQLPAFTKQIGLQ
jgi:uncharacterized membrane protein YeiH